VKVMFPRLALAFGASVFVNTIKHPLLPIAPRQLPYDNVPLD